MVHGPLSLSNGLPETQSMVSRQSLELPVICDLGV